MTTSEMEPLHKPSLATIGPTTVAKPKPTEEEARKMQVELPLLLQDLGQSKLLLKYQQQKQEFANKSGADNSMIKTENTSKTPPQTSLDESASSNAVSVFKRPSIVGNSLILDSGKF